MQQKMPSEITEEELVYFSRQFANMFGMPVRLYQDGKEIYSYFTINLIVDPIILCIDEIMQKKENVGYYVYNNFFYYGMVNHDSYQFIAGSVTELKVSEHELKKLGFSLHLEKVELPLFVSEMHSLSGMHLDTLLQSLILYSYAVNRTMYNISDIRIGMTEQGSLSSEMKEKEISFTVGTDFYGNSERSFFIEKDITKKILQGDVEGLIDGATKIPAVSSGQLAPYLLRHQKNFFIRLETIAARAAIQAGLDVDEVFSIEEKYIVKCESLGDIDRIKNLQYHMILDYADRVRKLHQYHGASSDLVRKVTKYIRSHISESIKTSDIAAYCGKSRGGMTTEFKKQTGMNLSDFIKMKKIQEAEELLYETDQSLASVSSFLGFSSQSHFCKVFKEIKGITPTEYRKKK